jgi:transcriptional regulator with XRE-family HTH domain
LEERESFNLKNELKTIGMTQKDFAKHISKTTSTVNRWAIGEVEIPKVVKLYILTYRKLKACYELKN